MATGQDKYVQFIDIQKSYDGETLVVKDLNLGIRRGEFLTMLGPSGSGKTTTLLMLAGFEVPTHGRIMLDGRPIDNMPPHKRNIGMVFQNYALFPHMTVEENLAFPLEVRKISKAEQQAKIKRALEMVKLAAFGKRRPGQLSGGQQQRVAVARALVFEPQLVLMDEPLGALDKQLREQMQLEIKHIHHDLGVSIVYVTHDQSEALTMSDRIAVMNAGVIEQIGDGKTIYDQPATAFVASFVGENNPFPGKVLRAENGTAIVETAFGALRGRNAGGLRAGDRAILFVRPESLRLGQGSAETTIGSNVLNVAFEGNASHIFLKGAGKKDITLTVGRHEGAAIPEQGASAAVSYDPDLGLVLPDGKLASE